MKRLLITNGATERLALRGRANRAHLFPLLLGSQYADLADVSLADKAVTAHFQFFPDFAGHVARITGLRGVVAFSIRIAVLAIHCAVFWRHGSGKSRGGNKQQYSGDNNSGSPGFHGSSLWNVALLYHVNGHDAITIGER